MPIGVKNSRQTSIFRIQKVGGCSGCYCRPNKFALNCGILAAVAGTTSLLREMVLYIVQRRKSSVWILNPVKVSKDDNELCE